MKAEKERACALGITALGHTLTPRVKTIPRRCGPFTPLSWAAREGHIEVTVQYPLAPLSAHPLEPHDTQVVKRLLEAGADVENRVRSADIST